MTDDFDTEALAHDLAPAKHETTSQQQDIIKILRSVGDMAQAAIPLLSAIPDDWYDWPCDNMRYPQTCNTVENVSATAICEWCRNQAKRPYAAGFQDGRLSTAAEAIAAKTEEAAKPPAKKATAKKAPAKRAAKKTTKR